MKSIDKVPEEILDDIDKALIQSEKDHKKELRRLRHRKNERRYYYRHKAKIIAKVVLWQQQNREEYNAKMRKYHDRNRERNRQYQRNYRLKKKLSIAVDLK